MDKDYQYNFSDLYNDASFDIENKKNKAKMIHAVLENQLNKKLSSKRVLDIGASTGFIANYLADYTAHVTGIDIDEKAINYAKSNFKKDNLEYDVVSATELIFPDKSFDIIICNHIYEHVPNDKEMFQEIARVLSKNGICYFSAGNKICIKEPHYGLPFLSILPIFLANMYLRILNRGSQYYEKHRTYWGLKSLVKEFYIEDYTLKIISNSDKYHAEYMIKTGSIKQNIAKLVINYIPWLCPSYIWVLKKK